MNRLLRVARVCARLAPRRWLWAERNAEVIAAHWARRVAARPALFNGRVLMVGAIDLDPPGAAEIGFFETDYANMLTWLDLGCPGEPVWNGYGAGALVAADGAVLLGRMGAHTANAGQLYCPCGTPDRDDVASDGTVDLVGSLSREIAEETGLAPADYALEPGWRIVEAGGLLSFMKIARLALPAEAVRERIMRFIAAQERPELAGIEILRPGGDWAAIPMPKVIPLFLRDLFGQTE